MPSADQGAPDGDVFGAPIDAQRPLMTLALLVADPDAHEGTVIRTSGRVHRVCARRGCWMELAADGVEPVRVPMAGHAFLVPMDAAGRRAEVEGVVQLREPSQAEREHLESEGATAAGRRLEIVATGVRLDPSN